jgi:DNA-binding FadR family transcriptional regulator
MPPNAVLEKLEEYIPLWSQPSTGRLPPERELANRLGVGRKEVRKALSVLEDQGRIVRHVGRGTFLAERPDNLLEAAEKAALRTSPRAAMEARLAIEPQLARLAAQNATAEQILELQDLCGAMKDAGGWDGYAELDWRFHNLIAEATGNNLLIEIQALLNTVRRRVVWVYLDTPAPGPRPDYHSFAEHEAIAAAIAARNGEAAAAAMRRHVDATRQRLLDSIA